MSIELDSGKRVKLRNSSAMAVRYRVKLGSAGDVEFDVLPGAEFSFCSFGHDVEVSIMNIQSGGLRVVANPDPGGE